ncbi:MAG: hypothetical protein AB7G34_09960 [Hyphomicrobiales bacterium]
MAAGAAAAVLLCLLTAAPARAVTCGGFNQPECRPGQGARSCEGGLVLQGGRCVRRNIQIPNTGSGSGCGGRNQPPCSQLPSRQTCASGYVRNPVTGRCETPRKCAPDDLDCRYLR